jgi:ribosomal protein S27AE
LLCSYPPMTDIRECKRCGGVMLPWKHSDAWRALTCWSCYFVVIERIDEQKDERAVAGGDR